MKILIPWNPTELKLTKFHIIDFTMTPNRWKKNFNAIGIIPSSGKYSKGTFAHPDIAFEFASWLSPEFKLYLITEFERLKTNEAYQYKVEWSATRLLSKVNTLGHYNVETTENYYVTSSFASRKEVSEKFEQTISSKVIEQIINKKD